MTKSTGIGRGNNPNSWSNAKHGADHHRWNSGRMLSEDGYVKVRLGVGHPLADSNGYAYEHLVVWCAAGHPRPGKGETLHHRNEDKADNRYGNLELLTRGEHNALAVLALGYAIWRLQAATAALWLNQRGLMVVPAGPDFKAAPPPSKVASQGAR